MPGQGQRTVLISEPQLKEMGLPYLPVMWGILKSYFERNGSSVDRFTWLDPIHQMAEVDTLLSNYDVTSIDVLGLSSYVWNWELQQRIASEVKRQNPECLIVAGGPEPDYKDPEFFTKHPYIDIVAVQDGEITFTKILEETVTPAAPLTVTRTPFVTIPGLYLPDPEGGPHIFTGKPELPTDFSYSPYVDQTEYYERLRAELSTNMIAVWETNRGCPYRCNFCDWGSNTMSKIRKFDLERVRAEVDWFGRMQISFLMLADANFGILKRDVEIAELVAAANATHNYPAYISYNTAKNNPDRTVEIARILLASGLSSAHVLSIQHTDERVLEAADRKNIHPDRQVAVVREMMQDNIPIYVQLILGIPGDSYDRWKRCFTDLMEWGIHSYYWVFPYSVLPNAPVAEPESVKQWEIETRSRYVLLNPGARPPGAFDPVMEATSNIIVKTSTFDTEDWVQMNSYGAAIKALHNCAFTQSIAIYLRCTHGISYADFYDAVIERFLQVEAPGKALWTELEDHFRNYLESPDAVDFMPINELPEFGHEVEPSRWFFVQLCRHADEIFGALETFLTAEFPKVVNLGSMVNYQQQLVVLPSYEPELGKFFEMDLDWIDYFERAHKLITPETLEEPVLLPGALVQVSDREWSDEGQTRAFDWHSRTSWGEGDEAQRWGQWIHTTVVGRNSALKNNFTNLSITATERAALA